MTTNPRISTNPRIRLPDSEKTWHSSYLSRIVANKLLSYFLCSIFRLGEAQVPMTNAKGGASEKV